MLGLFVGFWVEFSACYLKVCSLPYSKATILLLLILVFIMIAGRAINGITVKNRPKSKSINVSPIYEVVAAVVILIVIIALLNKA